MSDYVVLADRDGWKVIRPGQHEPGPVAYPSKDAAISAIRATHPDTSPINITIKEDSHG